MSQISPPIRILLVLAVAVMGVYMMFLRPKTEEVPPVEPSTTVTQPGTTGVASGETESAATTKREPAKADAAATPAEDVKGLPKPVQSAIRQDKVVVLLFWNDRAADDRAVHKALGKVDRHDGRVFVKAAPIKEISRYGRIARGVNVEQSPTIVVADRELRAQTLVGYSDRQAIDQAVTDALQNSTGLFTSSYLKSVDQVCVQFGNTIAATPNYYGGGDVSKMDGRLARMDTAYGRFAADFKAIKAPKRYAGFRSATIADVNAFNGHLATYSGAVTAKSSVPSVLAAERRFRGNARATNTRINKRFDSQGLYRCGTQF